MEKIKFHVANKPVLQTCSRGIHEMPKREELQRYISQDRQDDENTQSAVVMGMKKPHPSNVQECGWYEASRCYFVHQADDSVDSATTTGQQSQTAEAQQSCACGFGDRIHGQFVAAVKQQTTVVVLPSPEVAPGASECGNAIEAQNQ